MPDQDEDLSQTPILPSGDETGWTIRQIAEHCTDLIIVTDRDGEIAYVSPSSMTMLGYTPEEFPGAALNDDQITCREIARTAGDGEENRERAHEAGREIRVRRRDGAYATLDVRCSPIYAGGARQGTLVIAREVTDLKREEERLREVNKRLTLLSSGHQARNPQPGGGAGRISRTPRGRP